MKAVILAAGKGTRLMPITLDTPKTLVKIHGKPIIEYIIESLPDEVDEIIIVVSHLSHKIKDFLGDYFNNKKIIYIEQGEVTGTFGAVLSAKNLIASGERFLVTNGDDIHKKEEFLQCIKYPRSMAVQKKVMPNYYSIEINNNGQFSGFRPQTNTEKQNGAFVATGVYVLDTNIFKHPGIKISTGEYGLPQTVLDQTGEYAVQVVETNGWLPINFHEDIKIAEEYLYSN